MKEFMFLIRNDGADKEGLSPVKHLEFLNECKKYINELKRDGRLISAQPLVREGKIISGTPKAWNVSQFIPSNEVQVGYYHILANDMDEAVAIAKKNPEFFYSSTAKIEVRPVKMAEETTGFVYPSNSL
jgi:hypothetical protein